jgi:hypothetical protein
MVITVLAEGAFYAGAGAISQLKAVFYYKLAEYGCAKQ